MLTSYQFFSSEHATARSRSTGRRDTFASRDLRSREREGKVSPRPAPRSSQHQALVVHHLLLKVRLGVVTHRAHLRRLGTNV